jgi:O-antigen ligase
VVLGLLARGVARGWGSLPRFSPWAILALLPWPLVLALHGAWMDLFKGLEFIFCLALPLWLCPGDRPAWRACLAAFLALGLAASALGLAQAFRILPALGSEGQDRGPNGMILAHSFFGHHNSFGAFLLGFIPLSAASAALGRRAWAMAGLAALSAGLAALALTFSRGSWAGLALGALAAGFLLPGRWKLIPPIGVLALALGIFALPLEQLQMRVVSAFDDPHRAILRAIGLQVMDGYWAWGAGFGSVARELPRRVMCLPIEGGELANMSRHLHNAYLMVLVEGGVASLAAWLCLMTSPLLLALWAWRRGQGRAWVLAFVVAWAGIMAQSFTDLPLGYARGVGVGLCWGLMLAGCLRMEGEAGA